MTFKAIGRPLKRIFGSARRDSREFDLESDPLKLSEGAIEAAKAIRGRERPPAIIIHGVMPRSGTVYAGELLRLHPDLHAYPNHVWEFPFLGLAGGIRDLQGEFLGMYRRNEARMERHDFLPLFGASLIAYLYSFVPDGKRMLLKAPNVRYLNWFHVVFPFENLLLLMRDGRDVVSSTIKTWPKRKRGFGEVCKRWNDSARVLLDFESRRAKMDGFLSARFEQIVKDPESFAASACDAFDLNAEAYPFDKIGDLPVRGSSTVVPSKARGTGWDPIEKPKDFSPTDRWKDWSPAQKRTFKKIAGSTLVDAGYCRDLDW
ncbi:MAG TPA: sulfotransferase [Gammaproteobacteria bacterium]|nr:sulfotransferase [Gammaproteobacteria bacterium]